MKKKFKSKFPILAIAAAVAACLILTGIILARQLASDATKMLADSDFLQNAYITSTDDGKICFLCDGESYEYDGVLSDDYTGIADIAFENGKMIKIYTKSTSVSGTLLSYTEDTLRISGYGTHEMESSDTLACYVRQSDGSIAEGNFSDCIVGTTEGTFIFENGTVCAVIVTETATITDISVLLKNGEFVYRDAVYITADAEFTITVYDAQGTGDSQGDGSEAQSNAVASCESGDVILVASILSEYFWDECEITCPNGLLYFCDSDGNPTSEGYEGTFHIMQTDSGYVVVNTLPLEDYVRYVLPSEMPASFSFEALKAQAVCARTFACAQVKNNTYAEYGANLDDSTSYQVYNSSGSNETMDQAVADTAGQVLTCNGELITCYYYSTSPGFTTTTSVWGSDSPSYLVRRNCLLNQEENASAATTAANGAAAAANVTATDGTAAAANITATDGTAVSDASAMDGTAAAANATADDYDLSDESALTSFLLSEPESYDSASPFYRWTATVNLANITDDSLGTLSAIRVVSRNESGYITELECTWEKETTTLTNENTIRHVLGAGLTGLTLSDGTTRDFTTIPSACFCITDTNGTVITLTGGGFGHGVGMSQYGASAMGNAGWTYEEILSFYYYGCTIFSS